MNSFEENAVARRHGFSLEQYKLVYGELSAIMIRLQELFRYGLIGIAIMYSWVIGQAFGADECGQFLKLPIGVIVTGLLLPPAFILYAIAVSGMAGRLIKWMYAYLHRCETTLGYSDLSYSEHSRKKQSEIDRAMKIAWASPLIVAVAASGYLIYAVTAVAEQSNEWRACVNKREAAAATAGKAKRTDAEAPKDA